MVFLSRFWLILKINLAVPHNIHHLLCNYQMAFLQESLNKFKKQQEMCQSTLSNIKAGSKPTSKGTPYSNPAPVNAKSPAPAVKFSNDTERLQHINSIRKGSVGAQIKRVIDLLREVQLSLRCSGCLNLFYCCSLEVLLYLRSFLVNV